MKFLEDIKVATVNAVSSLYGLESTPDDVLLQNTRKEFEGDYTVVIFPYVKAARKSPDQVGKDIGDQLIKSVPFLEDYNVASGFLNLKVNSDFWHQILSSVLDDPDFGSFQAKDKKVLIEFSSPNTNKPLHLGHIRNILLGWSCSRLLEKVGYDVVRTQVINDRGIAICKSMLAWQKMANGQTPESSGIKGDHLVGDYYVAFERAFQEEYQGWQGSPEGQKIFSSESKEGQSESEFFKKFKNTYFNSYSVLGKEAKEMLLKWEQGDPETIELWKRMNSWVYKGFEETYAKLGVDFDDTDYESQTYLLGKDVIQHGLEKGVFYREPDSSVWIDLEDSGLDKKLVLRSDGTSVYITQDIGTAQQRFDKYGMDKMIYVVADEQDYHFQVLFEILKHLGAEYADGLFHLSYGMVDLPSGKMKSREGTVVDADDLIAEVIGEARASSEERGELADLDEKGREEIYRKVGLAALKFFILKVAPKKRMVFDPKESVDMQGQTGPYIQNAYVRIQSIFRKGEGSHEIGSIRAYQDVQPAEKELITTLVEYPATVEKAASSYEPSVVANYVYDLARKYHRFYHDHRVLTAETEAAKAFRMALSKAVGRIMYDAMDLLGIEMPERM